jgi:hypothetical protein
MMHAEWGMNAGTDSAPAHSFCILHFALCI